MASHLYISWFNPFLNQTWQMLVKVFAVIEWPDKIQIKCKFHDKRLKLHLIFHEILIMKL